MLDKRNLNIKEKHASINNNNSNNITLPSNLKKTNLATHDKILQ